jgi:hypothetical protein
MSRMNPLRQSIADTVSAVSRAFVELHRREPIGPWLEQFPEIPRREQHSQIGSIGLHCATPSND